MGYGGDYAAPIFVVGTSRSGTALMRSILNNHPDVYLAGETHYFADLRLSIGNAGAETASSREIIHAENYFMALTHRPYGHEGVPDKGQMDRFRFRETARSLGNGTDSCFEAYCRMEAFRHGKTTWGEKTPRHVYHIDQILASYPGARVICMLRDPRAVVASYRDWKNQGGFDFERDPTHKAALSREEARTVKSYHPIILALLWRSAITAALDAQHKYGADRVHIQSYEQLVTEPDNALKHVCRWLGLRHHPSMLEVPVHNSSYVSYEDGAGVVTRSLGRWSNKLSSAEIGVIQLFCGNALVNRGYCWYDVGVPWRFLFRSGLTLPWCVLRAAAANRDRVGNLPAFFWRRMKTVWKRGRCNGS